MTACAHDKPVMASADFYACPEPEPYPKNPTSADLIYALNDTYLAWESCHAFYLENLKAKNSRLW